jgi:prophage tail gpP-like protein
MICEAILKIKSDAQVSVSGRDIDTCTITWHDGNPTNITKDQIKAQIPNVEQDIVDIENNKTSGKAKLKTGEALTDAEVEALFG